MGAMQMINGSLNFKREMAAAFAPDAVFYCGGLSSKSSRSANQLQPHEPVRIRSWAYAILSANTTLN